MPTLLLYAVLLVGVVVLTPLADRVRVPSPVLLTLFGLALPLLPGVPGLDIRPDLILPVVLPPLLFAATQRSTTYEFRSNARPILLLAVGLTVVSAGAAAVLAHLAGLGWGPAWVLGAIVSPPDPVAATAVARRLRLPDRIVTVLEGEGMFNDATALVLYTIAVSAVVTGHVTVPEVGLRLAEALVAGVGIGLLAGVVTKAALAALHDAAPETTVTVGMPFAAYLLAEHLHGSGVLAVLTLGLYLRSYAHSAITSGGWLLGRAVWQYADYLITSVVFVLIGFELTSVLQGSDVPRSTVLLAVGVIALMIAIRFGWMFPAVALARVLQRGRPGAAPYGRRETFIVAWAGMRGVVTVAASLALPLTVEGGVGFPSRDAIVVVGLATVLATLVLQGLTLAPLVTRLGVGSDADTAAHVAELRLRAARAALQALNGVGEDVPEPIRRAVRLQYEGYAAAQSALAEVRTRGPEDEEDLSEQLGELQRLVGEAERDVVLRARVSGEVSAEVADEVLLDVEARAVRDLD